MGIADSIAGAIGACVLNRKNVRAEPGDENASLDHGFSAPSVDGQKRCENASVDAELFICFRGTKNGGFQRRISVDRALLAIDYFFDEKSQNPVSPIAGRFPISLID